MDRIFQKSNKITVRKLENEVVIVPLDEGTTSEKDCLFYFEDPTSVQIWELIDGKRKIIEIIEEIAASFNIEKDKIKDDIVNFISELRDNSLILEKTQKV